MSFRMHFQEVPHSSYLRRKCVALSTDLQEEFPEIIRFEITHSHAGEERTTLVHVTGKQLDVASSANSRDPRESVNDAFDRVRRQLRKRHDKKVTRKRRAVPLADELKTAAQVRGL